MLFYGLLGGFEWLRHHISRWDGRHALTSSARGSFSGPETAVKEIRFFESFGGAHFRLVVYSRGLSVAGGSIFPGVAALRGFVCFQGLLPSGVTHSRGKLIRGVYASPVITKGTRSLMRA